MTFQPPPPPPGGNPPPPPPGQWGPPPTGGAGGAAAFDPKNVNPLDWAAVGAGVLAFIFSFIAYYTASVDVSGKCPPGTASAADNESASASAWHGFFGWFGTLLALVGAGLIAMELFAPQVKLPIPTRLAALGAFALAALSTILALFITPGPDSASASFGGCTISAGVGHGFGYWASLIVILAGLVVSLMRFQQTGGQLPGPLAGMPNIGAKGPQGGVGGGTGGTTPPAPGSGPPGQ